MALKQRITTLRSRISGTLKEVQTQALARSASNLPPVKAGDEPPVVARLVVEIRSDGTQTIARGALEDVAGGERVAVEARGSTPAQLAASLARTVFTAPMLAGAAVRAVMDSRKPKREP